MNGINTGNTSCGCVVSWQTSGTFDTSQSSTFQSSAAKTTSLADRKEDAELSLIEKMKEAKEKADEMRERLKLPTQTNYGTASIEAYARLARARTTTEVNAAAGYARRRIWQLKSARRSDSDHAREIQAVINQLQKAVGRAGKKKTELQRERLTELRQKKLEMEKQSRKAMQVRQQLLRHKTQRGIREAGYIREAEIDNRLQAQLTQNEMELREQMQTLTAAAQPSVDAVIQQYTAQSLPESAAPAAEVNVQA